LAATMLTLVSMPSSGIAAPAKVCVFEPISCHAINSLQKRIPRCDSYRMSHRVSALY
jgi:hypothetical protein